MKYVVSWAPRQGASAMDNEASVKRSLAVFSKWSAPSDQTFKEFVTRLDGEGGFAVIETDNPTGLLDGPAKFSPFFAFSIYPVVDVGDGVNALNEAIEFRDSIT